MAAKYGVFVDKVQVKCFNDSLKICMCFCQISEQVSPFFTKVTCSTIRFMILIAHILKDITSIK